MYERNDPGKRRGERGFTLIEALVSVVVMSLLVLLVVTMFQSSNKMTRKATVQGDSQQSARVAVDMITRDLRSTGYDLDVANGQQAIVYASPWDIIFNANVNPSQDDAMAPGTPEAIDIALAPATVPPGGPLYSPTATFTSGAETIRFTLDSSGDGVLDANDLDDDAEEATPNPRDFVLLKEIYGAAGDGTNGGNGEPVAMVRGPVADQDGLLPTPLFQYWLDDDDDEATPEILWGDGNADGSLSQGEIAALTPVPNASLALITRSVITVTGEDSESDGKTDYRTRQMISSVAFRNYVRRTGVVTGFVFQDQDSDGNFDSDETPIANVTVRLSTGATETTNTNGRYVFDVAPGSYTVTELDPSGYTSTTPNTVAVAVGTGTTDIVSFGDRPGSGVGTIKCLVWNDRNSNGSFDGGDSPMEGVSITLHTGQTTVTDANGRADFSVPVGSYTVVESDPVGYASITPNAVEVVLTYDGDVQVATFGDIESAGTGTIEGLVYLDLDKDGVYDTGEPGISDVPVSVAGRDSTVTDGNGNFQFSVAAGLYDVVQYDLVGYSSSTPNVQRVLVQVDSTVAVEYGDIYDTSLNFTVVTVGQTDRALSIASANLREDNKGDSDIILGTQVTAGSNNLHGWHNARKNSGTAITALFDANPSFSRNAGAPIPAMLTHDFNYDGVPDLLTGLDTNVSNNLKVWTTITSGGSAGQYGNSPSYQFITGNSSTVLSLAKIYWPGWSTPLFLVGTRTTAGYGNLEVWVDTGGGYLAHVWSSDIMYDAYGSLGEVSAIAVGDFNADGYSDIAIGQDNGSYAGRVSIFLADPTVTWSYRESAVLRPAGAALSLSAVDMAEDGDGDVDLLVGTSIALGAGHLELWHNERGAFGVADSLGMRTASDWLDADGEVLSMDTSFLDPDVFPDVITGIRTTSYAGALNVYRTFGYLPSSGSAWSHVGSGEVVTLTVDDFNIDGLADIAVGTRTAATTGELVVYFGQ